MDLVKLSISKFSVENETEISIKQHFEPFEKQAEEWAFNANSIQVTHESQTEMMEGARTARLALKNIRLNIEKTHKALKEDSLKKGQLLDLIKRTLIGYIEPIEDHLLEQEDFIKIQEKKHKAELRTKRLEMIETYRFAGDGYDSLPFQEMAQDAFDTFLLGIQSAYEIREQERIDAEKIKAENERLAIAEREKVQADNAKLLLLKRSAEKLSSIGFFFDFEKSEYVHYGINCSIHISDLKQEDFGFDVLYESLKERVSEYNSFQRDIKKQNDLKVKLEREEKERLENEIKIREQLEEQERKDKAAEQRKMKRAPDKQKLLSFAERIKMLEPVELKDDDAIKIYNDAQGLLAKVVKHIEDKAQNL